MVRLITVLEQTRVAGFSARIRTLVFKSVRIEVANEESAPRQPCNHLRVVHQLPKDARSSLRRFVEQELRPIRGSGHGLTHQLAWLKLKVLLNGLLQRCLQASHFSRRTRRLELDDQRVF